MQVSGFSATTLETFVRFFEKRKITITQTEKMPSDSKLTLSNGHIIILNPLGLRLEVPDRVSKEYDVEFMKIWDEFQEYVHRTHMEFFASHKCQSPQAVFEYSKVVNPSKKYNFRGLLWNMVRLVDCLIVLVKRKRFESSELTKSEDLANKKWTEVLERATQKMPELMKDFNSYYEEESRYDIFHEKCMKRLNTLLLKCIE